MIDRVIRHTIFCLLLSLLLSGCGAHVYHQVRKGDTLYSISFRYHQDYREVAKWNQIPEPYIVKEGQWLRITAPTEPAGLTPAPVYKTQPIPAVVSSRAQSPTPSATHKSTPSVVSAPVTQSPSKASGTVPKSQEVVVSSSRESISWQWPVNGVVISQYKANTIGRQGLDMTGARGMPVNAAASGKVVYSGNALRGYGNLVIIKHNDKYLSAYGHNDTLLVKEGDAVNRGEVIARMGSSGTDRVKLHFQIRVDGKPVDPIRYLPKRGS